MSQPTYEVQLAVYDLSRGMARGLSAQFLGPAHAIDIIPHTGIVVYGLEYYFGGGIQAADPTQFRQSSQMFPIEVQSLGRTSVSKNEFEEWCRNAMRTGEYNAMAYDLLTRNCNNFSHDAALRGLGLSRGVPDWILQVPQRFLASPMGQMVRPMLEQMQVTGGGGGSSPPFANESTARPVVGSTPTAPSVSADNNPWANIPDRKESSNVTPIGTNEPSTPSITSPKDLSTPVLDAHDRPLLSNDTKAVGACVSKLTKSLADDTDASKLEELSQLLTNGTKPPDQLVEGSCRVFLKIVKGGGSDMVFALMLLRLVVLHPTESEASGENDFFGQCLDWVGENIQRSDVLSVSARAMAWCTLSNAYQARSSLVASLDDIVEAAMMDLNPESQSRSEVRQSAAALLYNVSHVQSPLADHASDELPDLLVSLLCGSLDGLDAESDATTRLRRLLVAGRIVRPGGGDGTFVVNAAAKALVADLGFTDAIKGLVGNDTSKGGDEEKVKKLAAELLRLVED